VQLVGSMSGADLAASLDVPVVLFPQRNRSIFQISSDAAEKLHSFICSLSLFPLLSSYLFIYMSFAEFEPCSVIFFSFNKNALYFVYEFMNEVYVYLITFSNSYNFGHIVFNNFFKYVQLWS
jgi:hypothetical protein